ncbi:hypothetical protein L596_027650 [Steinernema carpocapsae]|uniref:Amine oxidase domain-containing protein n=1 Tax=Steinernema carpocapsae TaxID=34508 RepID=A0A4U5LW49_STECR|nr:hypothetical protein L596_027650 [Steinernema carpocapsae]
MYPIILAVTRRSKRLNEYFSSKIVHLWNSLPEVIVRAKNASAFKRKVRRWKNSTLDPENPRPRSTSLSSARVFRATRAAREIKTKSPHLKVMVVEVKDRVGGRTYTVDLKAANGKTDKWDMAMDRFDPKIRPEAHRRVWTGHLRAAHERKEGVAGRKPEDSSPRSADPFLERIQNLLHSRRIRRHLDSLELF